MCFADPVSLNLESDFGPKKDKGIRHITGNDCVIAIIANF